VIVFVSFEPGCRGHYSARVLSSLPNIYWYSHPDNGINPWNVANYKLSNIRQRQNSKFHFDRLVPNGKLPPTHDYVADFFPNKEQYYTEVFWPHFNQLTQDIKQDIIYCTHSMPSELDPYFPKSKYINIRWDPDEAARRFLMVSAAFPGYIRAPEIVPADNEWLHQLATMKLIKPDFTQADVWCWKQHRCMFEEKYKKEYIDYIYNRNLQRYKMRHGQEFEVTASTKWSAIKNYLAS
jgi:hypothetical protein